MKDITSMDFCHKNKDISFLFKLFALIEEGAQVVDIGNLSESSGGTNPCSTCPNAVVINCGAEKEP